MKGSNEPNAMHSDSQYPLGNEIKRYEHGFYSKLPAAIYYVKTQTR